MRALALAVCLVACTKQARRPPSESPRDAGVVVVVQDAAPPAPALRAIAFDTGWGPCDPSHGPCSTTFKVTDCRLHDDHGDKANPRDAVLDKADCDDLMALAKKLQVELAHDDCGKVNDYWEIVVIGEGPDAPRKNVTGCKGAPWEELRVRVQTLRAHYLP